MVLAEVSEWMAEEVAEGMSQCIGGGNRTCRGEEDDDVESIVGGSASSEKTPPRSRWDVICAGSVPVIHALQDEQFGVGYKRVARQL